MRSLLVVSGVYSSVVAGDSTPNPGKYKPIFDVFGDPTKSPKSLTKSIQVRPNGYYDVRTPTNCTFPIQLAIVQDATASFLDDFAQMKNVQLKEIVDNVLPYHPGSTLGVVSHRDKPFPPYGNASDYCQRFDVPLTSDLAKLTDFYDKESPTGGGDPPENSFGALLAAAQSQTTGWSNDLATNVLIVSTDAPPHFANDTQNVFNLPPFPGDFDEANAEAQCKNFYYPSPEQVRSKIYAREAYVVFLVFDPSDQDFLVLRSWEWVNKYLGQSDKFLNKLANDSSDFWKNLEIALKEIVSLECVATTPTPTTVTTPTATPPTTTQTPTTSPTTVPPTTATECGCDVCPEPPCQPCGCAEGVLIKLRFRPLRMKLIVENDISPGLPTIPGVPARPIPGSSSPKPTPDTGSSPVA